MFDVALFTSVSNFPPVKFTKSDGLYIEPVEVSSCSNPFPSSSSISPELSSSSKYIEPSVLSTFDMIP